jgi:hypothetical protein
MSAFPRLNNDLGNENRQVFLLLTIVRFDKFNKIQLIFPNEDIDHN